MWLFPVLMATLQLAQTAKAQMPGNHAVDDTLGLVYIKKNLSSLAVPPLLAATKAAPQVASYHYHLGLAYAAAGDDAKARAALEKALSISETFEGVQEARRVLAGLKG